jgi:rfaE bifunctional protein kinase chain/domain
MNFINDIISAINGASIFVLGDVCLDEYIFGTVSCITKEAPVPALHEEKRMFYAGQAGNVSVNASALGGKVRFFTSYGDDEAGILLNDILEENNISVKRVKTDFTTHRVKLLNQDKHQGYQHLYHIYKENIPDKNSIDGLCEGLISEIGRGDILVCSDYSLGVIDKEWFLKLNEVCKTIVNTRNPLSFFRGADMIICNEEEVLKTYNDNHKNFNFDEIVIDLMEAMNFESILVTRGSDGMTFFTEDFKQTLLPENRNIVDVTGAGDAVVSTISVCIASGKDIESSLRFANIVAGVIVGKEGTGVCNVNDVFSVMKEF